MNDVWQTHIELFSSLSMSKNRTGQKSRILFRNYCNAGEKRLWYRTKLNSKYSKEKWGGTVKEHAGGKLIKKRKDGGIDKGHTS